MKVSKIKLSIILAGLSVISAQLLSQTTKKHILPGPWYNVWSPKNTYSFQENGSFSFTVNEFISFEGKWEFKKEGILKLDFEDQANDTMSLYYTFRDDLLTIWNYKSGKYSDHIDEIGLYSRSEKPELNITGSDNRGDAITIDIKNVETNRDILISFPNFSPVPVDPKFLEDRKLSIDGEQYTGSELVITPWDISTLNIRVIFNGNPVPVVNYAQLVNGRERIKELCMGDELIACVYDFNQIGRPAINSLYGKPVTGDVLLIKVGYPDDLAGKNK